MIDRRDDRKDDGRTARRIDRSTNSTTDKTSDRRPDLLQTRQEEGLQAFAAGIRTHLTDVVEEGRPQLPVTVVQEGDHCRQQEVIAFPACSTSGSSNFKLPHKGRPHFTCVVKKAPLECQ